MNTLLFLSVILFLVGFVSDLILQKTPGVPAIELLKPFWDQYGTYGSAALAGLTTLGAGLVVLTLSYLFFTVMGVQSNPWAYLLMTLAIAFVFGFFIDIMMNRDNWFGPSLRRWYDGMGEVNAAMWGGLALVFTVGIALLALFLFRLFF